MVLRFFHGRKTVDENLEDWGTNGPLLKVDSATVTYKSTLHIVSGDEDQIVLFVDDLIYYDGVYYGDISMFDESQLKKGDILEEFKAEKTDIPKS